MAIVGLARAAPPPTPDLDRRYPRLAAYLAKLPAGLDSYPQCQTRGTVAAEFVEDLWRGADGAEIPHEVAYLFTAPTAVWIPEVRLGATMLAICDHLRRSDDEHVGWLQEKNRKVLGGIVYRSLMAFMTPAALLEKSASRWESFHRGTSLAVERIGPREVMGRVSFPPHLISGLLPRAYGAALHAALEHSRARAASIDVEDVGPTWVSYRARWS